MALTGVETLLTLHRAPGGGADATSDIAVPLLPRGAPLPAALSHVVTREARVLASRVATDRRDRVAQRIRPPGGHGRGGRSELGRLVRSGLVVLPAATATSLLGVLVADAGVRLPSRVVITTGGGLMATTVSTAGAPVVLRVAEADGPSDPRGSIEVLRMLAPVAGVPRLLGHGEVDALAWTVEERLPGRPVRRLTPSLLSQVVCLLADLPRHEGPPDRLEGQLAVLSELLPDKRTTLAAVATRARAGLEALPAALTHGDLWTGNLLAQRGTLSGIVDWDGATTAGTPGVDLLHLLVTARRQRERLDLGAIWSRRPWEWVPFTGGAATRYWQAVGGTPDGEQRQAIGLAWWFAHVAGTLSRIPHRADDAAWVRRNVTAVLEQMPTRRT
jgi:hypothetical protein